MWEGGIQELSYYCFVFLIYPPRVLVGREGDKLNPGTFNTLFHPVTCRLRLGELFFFFLDLKLRCLPI